MSEAPHPTSRVFLVVIDDSQEMSRALRFACRRARHTGGRVALLRVTPPVEFQHWNAVGELMREDARAEAERSLQRLAADVQQQTGQIPVVHVREGEATHAVLATIDEEPSISVLILAASSGAEPGPLITFLTKRNFARLRVPVTIVPGSLSDADIDALS